MTDAVIELTHVQKKFGKFQALSDVSFTLHQGEVLGFLGPNGAGKSTTIRIILGMLKSNGGSVKVFGQDAWHDDLAIHPRIAYVPGDVYLWPNLSGGEIIDLLLRLNGQQHTEKTDELIQKFQFDPKKKARTYSKGNRQKVALIAALSQNADLYIFDEPTSGLDPLNEKTFQDQVAQLKRAGKSILLSSHILSEVEKMGDSIAIIRDGKVIETGDLSKLQQLSRLEITVTTVKPLDDFDATAGVYQLTFDDAAHTKAHFHADRTLMTTIMTALNTHAIVDILSAPPTLEDLFLRYYNETEVNGHATR